ncbi:unnamed protein product [Sphagnum jensenii]|uniref:HAT C-terminal dimerisation domain-containing protein n=1 Tax=Sphagnum jensenii TaxID=128206 RepID=A0ABP0W6E3_9BRYO
MWFAKLMAHLQPRIEPITIDGVDDEKVTIAADNDEIGPIKALLLYQLKEKYFFKPLHSVATYLDPLQKNCLLDCGFTQKLIDHGLLYLKDIMRKEDTHKRARLDGEVKHDVGLLPWWKIKSANFPILARTARAILCIPTSSSMLKCTFSFTGNTRTNKRNVLKPNTLNDLLYLRSNQDLDRSQ